MNRTLGIVGGGVALLFSALTPSAMAACTDTAPPSNTTVTCSGTGVPAVIAQPGSTGVTINIDSTASGSFVYATNPVAFSVNTSSTITNSGNLSLTGGGGRPTARGAELLAVAAEREARQIDEKLFLETCATPPVAEPKTAGRRR